MTDFDDYIIRGDADFSCPGCGEGMRYPTDVCDRCITEAKALASLNPRAVRVTAYALAARGDTEGAESSAALARIAGHWSLRADIALGVAQGRG